MMKLARRVVEIVQEARNQWQLGQRFWSGMISLLETVFPVFPVLSFNFNKIVATHFGPPWQGSPHLLDLTRY